MNFKSLCVFALAMTVTCGCATLNVERHVTDNTLTSTYPNLRLAIAPSFKYLGNIKERGSAKSTSPGTTLRVDHDAYVFVDRNPSNPRIEKILAIQIDKIEGYWISDIFFGFENKLETGALSLCDTTFQYCTSFLAPGGSGYVTRFIHTKGLYLPPGIAKAVGAVYGNRGDTKVTLLYLEDLGDGPLSKMNWRNKGDLTTPQKDYLEKFNERFTSVFKCLQPGEIPNWIEPAQEDQQEKSISVRLEGLRKLRDADLITEQEYENRKKEILNEL